MIELNGKRYNAHTGVLIDGVKKAAPVAQAAHIRPDVSKAAPSQKHTAERAKTQSKQLHKPAQTSHTLMRHAVKKPSTITNRTTVAMDVVAAAPIKHTATRVYETPNPNREKRAEAVHKLSVISRFGIVGNSDAAAKPPRMAEVIQAAPVAGVQKSHIAANVPSQSAMEKRAHTMLSSGMRSANSHTNTHSSKKARVHHRVGKKIGLGQRAASLTAGAMAVLVLGGFFAYQNIPNISVRYASAKSGVNASLPGYRPTGFSINSHVKYTPGSVSISYNANTDGRSYTLTQRTSSWNSQALKDHLAAKGNTAPQIYPSNGQTIYLHDDSSADWVNGGVWYSISGASNLDTDQLIKIATSI